MRSFHSTGGWHLPEGEQQLTAACRNMEHTIPTLTSHHLRRVRLPLLQGGGRGALRATIVTSALKWRNMTSREKIRQAGMLQQASA